MATSTAAVAATTIVTRPGIRRGHRAVAAPGIGIRLRHCAHTATIAAGPAHVSVAAGRGIDRAMARMPPEHAPMYRQVADQLAAEIASGELPPGHRVPSERVIAERHGLSRMTARQAVELLVRRGLVYRRPGSGTYVAAARVEHTLQWFAGFTEQMRAQGIEPGGRVLAVRLSGQDGSDAGVALELPEGEASWMVRRVRFGNGEPLLVEESHVPARLFPDLNRHNLAQSSLYDLMRSRYGVDPVRAHETIEPTACEQDEARHLATRPGAPAILVTRTAYDGDDRPVEYARDIYRGDRARFVVDLRRQQDGRAGVVD